MIVYRFVKLWFIFLVNAAGKNFPAQANGMFVTNAATASVHIAYLITEANTAVAASSAANAHTDI